MATYYGYIETIADAIMLFEACRLRQLPRVKRRLLGSERAYIKSGSVFVWDEQDANMQRWTDGKLWSKAKTVGCFLTYQEMEVYCEADNFTLPPRVRLENPP